MPVSRTTRQWNVVKSVPDQLSTGMDRRIRVRQMFARIVPRYDVMNWLMTAGLDGRWRRRTAALAHPSHATVLDLATGTGDLAVELIALGASRVVGADFCEPMLEAAARKVAERRVRGVELVLADALDLPFSDATFDAVTSAFLLRNVADLSRCLQEMRRVLRPGGRAVALDLTPQQENIVALGPRTYLRYIVPRIGKLVTGDGAAYRYLPASLEPFPHAERLAELIREAGFDDVGYRRLGFGTVAIHLARVA